MFRVLDGRLHVDAASRSGSETAEGVLGGAMDPEL